MAVNIHTDARFEKCLAWLSRVSHRTKTDVIKELVLERYRQKRVGFRFGVLRAGESGSLSGKKIQAELKRIDRDHDLD